MTPNLHLIGNAHLDPVWLWTWQEGYMEVLATFRSALDRLKESEDFIFTCSSACYYKWVEEMDRSMFEEIRQRVREGRWVIVGGWWIQPDDNLPCGESFARQALYSQRYYQEKFGITCKTGYCVDTFGHSAELPKLLVQGGMENFVFMRPGDHENGKVPQLFWWKSADGSKVLTMKLANGYPTNPSKEDLSRVYQKAEEIGSDLMYFYGVGNHGGGPTRKQLELLRQLNRQDFDGHLVFSSPDRFFDQVRSQKLPLPDWDTELQHHASGCYSATSVIKKALRNTENTLLYAEKFATIAMKMELAPSPAEELREAWDNIMFNQFHDILCGCTVKSAAEDALEMFAQSRAVGSKLLYKTLGRICKQIDTQIDGVTGAGKENWQIWEEEDNGVPVVLFNPHSHPIHCFQQVNAQLATVCNEKGEPLPLQYVYGDSVNGEDKYDTLFPAEIPSLGYAVYWGYKNRIVNAAVPRDNGPKGAFPEELKLENQFLSIVFDPDTGWISSIKEKDSDKELLGAPSGIPVIVDDKEYDTWAHYAFTFRNELAKLKATAAAFSEKGCNRSGIRVQYEYGRSRVWIEYLLADGRRSVEVRIKALWQEEHTQLKLSFTPALSQCSSIAEIPYGTVRRPSNGEEQPMLRWTAVEGLDAEGANRGFAVINDSKYSYDALENELRITLFRNCMFADHMGKRENTLYDFVDEGVHYITLALLPYQEEGVCQACALADEINCPSVAVFDTYHKGRMPRSSSFLTVDQPAVALTTLKPSEDGKGLVLRLAELSGKPVVCHLSSTVLGVEADIPFAPMEVKTLKLSGPDNAVEVTNFLE